MQLKKFRSLFEHARQNSKFYRDFYGANGVLDLKIERLSDIEKVPLINKDMFRKYSMRDIMTRDLNESIRVHSTSGSSGEPFKIAFDLFEDYSAHARLAKVLLENGYQPHKKGVLLSRYESGHQFAVETDIKMLSFLKGKFGLFRREMISIFDPPEGIIRKLNEIRPFLVWSTPSVIETVAQELKKNGRRLDIPLVLLMAENLTPSFIELFRERIGKKFIDLYGCMESPSIGYGVNQSDAKKIFCNSTLVEVVNRRKIGAAAAGDVVITNLINHTMPVIRYDLADYAEVLEHESFPNRHMGKIFGRSEDILYFGKNRTLTFHQSYQLFSSFHKCERYKIVQRPGGEIVLQLKVAENADKETVALLARQRWAEKYPEYPLTIEWVDDFVIDSKSGKFKVIEKLAG